MPKSPAELLKKRKEKTACKTDALAKEIDGKMEQHYSGGDFTHIHYGGISEEVFYGLQIAYYKHWSITKTPGSNQQDGVFTILTFSPKKSQLELAGH